MLAATKRAVVIQDPMILSTIPNHPPAVVRMKFFYLYANLLDAEVWATMQRLGLDPDLYGQAAVNENDSEFGCKYPNFTLWPGSTGGFNFSSFQPWSGVPSVLVGGGVPGVWRAGLWCGGRQI
jgi:hypothetical protein